MSRLRRIVALAAACIALYGCAAQTAFREGQARLAQDQLPQALERFGDALRLEPNSAEYRLAYMRTLERLVGLGLLRGDQAREAGDLARAEAEYRRVLGLGAANERALQGLQLVERQRRWDRSVAEAESAAARGAWDDVHVRMRALLLEAPTNRRARELMKTAEEELLRRTDARAAGTGALAAAYRRPISIEFRDAPLRTIFEVIARSSGLNFVFDKDVRTDQRTSVFLKDSSVEATVAVLLTSQQLEQKVVDANTVLIYPRSPTKQREHQSLIVRSFYLVNAEAKIVAAALRSLLKLREVVVDDRLNLVIVRETPEAIRIAERVVALHDVPEPEVMLEVEILEVKRTRLQDLGIRWPEQLSLSPLPSSSGGNLTLSDLRGLSSTTIGAGLGSLSITARATDTDANILANPRIRARNREKAKVHIGERVPNISITATPATGFISESVNYVDVGLKLDVEPTVHLDNEVAIRVVLEVSSIISQLQTKSGTLAYQIGTRTASTVLRLRDGENQVLAGLINDEDRRTANKVPGLGEVPVLGRLFGNQADDTAKTEIVLSITPRVLRNIQRPAAAQQEFESGTDASVGSRAADSGAAVLRVSDARTSTVGFAAPASSAPARSAVVAEATSTGRPAATAQTDALPTSLRWGSVQTGRVGDLVSIALLARSEQPLLGLGLTISYDPAVLRVEGVDEGTFLRQDGSGADFSSRIEPDGRILVSASRARRAEAASLPEAPLLSIRARILGRPAAGATALQATLAEGAQAPTGVMLAIQP